VSVPAFHVEAKLHGFRRTQEGVVVSFVVSPIDMPQALALDPLGTRYVLALCAIDDEEQPINPRGGPKPETIGNTQENPGHAPVEADGGGRTAGSIPATGATKSPGERAVIRAAILCSEPRFRIWMAGEDISTNEAAAMLREACGVESRANIAKDPAALDRFMKLETEYLIEIGAMARPL